MRFTESDTIELKSQVGKDICKEIIAFANTRGGTLYVGIADNGTVIGIDDADQVMLQISHMVRDSIKPDVTMFVRYETREAEGRQILAVTVQKGTRRPYYLAGKGLTPSGVYVRSGTSSDPATDIAIRSMIRDTDGDCFEDRRSLEQELTFASAARQFAKCGVPFDKTKMQTLGCLSSDGIYSNVAWLLSDQCRSTIKAAAFSGTNKNDFQDRREFGGSLFCQMEDLYAWLDMRNQVRATFSGLYRRDTRDYPEEALREALVNAIVHRDYSYSASTLVSVYDDRIELVSIGGLPDGITLDDILLGLSVCRNPKLAAVFYRLKLIEAYGTGLPKILHAYEGSGLSPRLEVTGNAFKITLPNRHAAAKKPGGGFCFCETGHPSFDQSGETDRESQILAFVRANGFIVRSQVDALLGVSQATANRLLKHMTAKGLLCQEGSGRSTRYRHKKSPV